MARLICAMASFGARLRARRNSLTASGYLYCSSKATPMLLARYAASRVAAFASVWLLVKAVNLAASRRLLMSAAASNKRPVFISMFINPGRRSVHARLPQGRGDTARERGGDAAPRPRVFSSLYL